MKAELRLISKDNNGLIRAYYNGTYIADSTMFWMDDRREQRACVNQMIDALLKMGYSEVVTDALPAYLKLEG